MENKKNGFNRYLIITAMVLALLIGFSYAFFTTTGGETDIGGKMADNFDINLEADNNGFVTVSSFIPIAEEDAEQFSAKTTFSVKTSGNDHPVKYSISLTDLTLPLPLQDDHFIWELICTSCADGTKYFTGNFAGKTQPSATLQENIDLGKTATDTYELRLWIKNSDTDNQIGMSNQTFKGKITVTAYMVYENETD